MPRERSSGAERFPLAPSGYNDSYGKDATRLAAISTSDVLSMESSMNDGQRKRSGRRSAAAWLAGALLLCLVPLTVVAYQSHRRELSWGEYVSSLWAAKGMTDSAVRRLPVAEKIDFLTPQPVGVSFTVPPQISNLEAVDLDQDGLLDIVVCDCEANVVSWIRQSPAGVFEEQVLADGLIAPAHVEANDFDEDGDLDLLVAVLGMLLPTDERIGAVVVLENIGQEEFIMRVLADRVARVSDVRGADLDGDGDKDLAVAQFGYDQGETRWMENLGNWNFRSHLLHLRSGGIHCEITDFNGDGHNDLALVVSQEWEEVYVFAGNGEGEFEPIKVFDSESRDFGSSGLWVHDLDQDGDPDILYTNGDSFDYLPPTPRPWHGVQWLENVGNFEFIYRRIGDVGGAVGAEPVDVDQDGDLDLVVVSAFNFWDEPESQSMIWLENTGDMQFVRRDITNTPSHIMALTSGGFDGDGRPDLVTGGMHMSKPYDRVERVMLWLNRWQTEPSSEAGRLSKSPE